jgi:hypothetical protein
MSSISQQALFSTMSCCVVYITHDIRNLSTYGHSQLKTGHPVRSAIHKQLNGRLVLRWVTTWESLLLYVLHISFACQLETTLQYETRDHGSVGCRNTAVGFLNACFPTFWVRTRCSTLSLTALRLPSSSLISISVTLLVKFECYDYGCESSSGF